MSNQQLAIPEAQQGQIIRSSTSRGLELHTLDDMWQFSQIVMQANTRPKSYATVEDVFIAVQMGAELGMSPMMSLQNIGVINGKPAPYGDAILALVYNSGMCGEFEEWFEIGGEITYDLPVGDLKSWPDNFTAVCMARRKNKSNQRISKFSVAMAKRAGLWGKTGPWCLYPDRMLKFRASGFCLRDEFPDVQKGFHSYEEVRDFPPEAFENYAPTTAAVAEPPKGRSKLPATLSAAPVAVAEEAPVDLPYVSPKFKGGQHDGKTPADVPQEFLEKCIKFWDKGNVVDPDLRAAVEAELDARRYHTSLKPEPSATTAPEKSPLAQAVHAKAKPVSDPEGEALFNQEENPKPSPKPKGAKRNSLDRLFAVWDAAKLPAGDDGRDTRIAMTNEWLKANNYPFPIKSWNELDQAYATKFAFDIQEGVFPPAPQTSLPDDDEGQEVFEPEIVDDGGTS